MKALHRVLLAVAGAALSGCSGIVTIPGYAATVLPAFLQQYSHGGSMSTLWYEGSDARYHYFRHSFKVSSAYRIRRSDLHWLNEFPKGSRKPVYCSPQFARMGN